MVNDSMSGIPSYLMVEVKGGVGFEPNPEHPDYEKIMELRYGKQREEFMKHWTAESILAKLTLKNDG